MREEDKARGSIGALQREVYQVYSLQLEQEDDSHELLQQGRRGDLYT